MVVVASRRSTPPQAPYQNQEPAFLSVGTRAVAEGSHASTLTAQGALLKRSTIPAARKLRRGSTLLINRGECSSMETVHVSAAFATAHSRQTRKANDGVLRLVPRSVPLLLDLRLDLLLDLLNLHLALLHVRLALRVLLDPLLESCTRRPLPRK